MFDGRRQWPRRLRCRINDLAVMAHTGLRIGVKKYFSARLPVTCISDGRVFLLKYDLNRIFVLTYDPIRNTIRLCLLFPPTLSSAS